MSRGHNVLRTMGQMALTSPSPSAASSSAAHSVRFIFTTAARSEEEKMQRRGPPRQPSSFGSGPGGSGRRPPMGGRQRRRSSDRGDREDRDAPQRGDAQNGRFRRARGAPRNRNDEEKEGNPVTISEGETFIDWYHSRGYKAFALPPEGRGPFWIAATPFPSNPSFDPPPPISQRYKDAMWALHLKDPKEYNLRFLSQHYGLTLERTHAVLRLKALEAEMTVKSQALQQDFQSNMERLLGSNPNAPPPVRPKRVEADEEEETRPRRAHEHTPVPVRRGIDASLDNRGPMIEDVTNEREGATTNDNSFVFKNLTRESSERHAKAAATPVGGPDPVYIERTPAQKHVQSAARHPDSAPVAILDLKGARSNVNYKGVGTLDQNRRAALRRSLRRRRSKRRTRRAFLMMRKWEKNRRYAYIESKKGTLFIGRIGARLRPFARRRSKVFRRNALWNLSNIRPAHLHSQPLGQKIKHLKAKHRLEIKKSKACAPEQSKIKVPSAAVPKVTARSSKSNTGTTSKAKHDRAEKKQVQKELAKKR